MGIFSRLRRQEEETGLDNKINHDEYDRSLSYGKIDNDVVDPEQYEATLPLPYEMTHNNMSFINLSEADYHDFVENLNKNAKKNDICVDTVDKGYNLTVSAEKGHLLKADPVFRITGTMYGDEQDKLENLMFDEAAEVGSGTWQINTETKDKVYSFNDQDGRPRQNLDLGEKMAYWDVRLGTRNLDLAKDAVLEAADALAKNGNWLLNLQNYASSITVETHQYSNEKTGEMKLRIAFPESAEYHIRKDLEPLSDKIREVLLENEMFKREQLVRNEGEVKMREPAGNLTKETFELKKKMAESMNMYVRKEGDELVYRDAAFDMYQNPVEMDMSPSEKKYDKDETEIWVYEEYANKMKAVPAQDISAHLNRDLMPLSKEDIDRIIKQEKSGADERKAPSGYHDFNSDMDKAINNSREEFIKAAANKTREERPEFDDGYVYGE